MDIEVLTGHRCHVRVMIPPTSAFRAKWAGDPLQHESRPSPAGGRLRARYGGIGPDPTTWPPSRSSTITSSLPASFLHGQRQRDPRSMRQTLLASPAKERWRRVGYWRLTPSAASALGSSRRSVWTSHEDPGVGWIRGGEMLFGRAATPPSGRGGTTPPPLARGGRGAQSAPEPRSGHTGRVHDRRRHAERRADVTGEEPLGHAGQGFVDLVIVSIISPAPRPAAAAPKAIALTATPKNANGLHQEHFHLRSPSCTPDGAGLVQSTRWSRRHGWRRTPSPGFREGLPGCPVMPDEMAGHLTRGRLSATMLRVLRCEPWHEKCVCPAAPSALALGRRRRAAATAALAAYLYSSHHFASVIRNDARGGSRGASS